LLEGKKFKGEDYRVYMLYFKEKLAHMKLFTSITSIKAEKDSSEITKAIS